MSWRPGEVWLDTDGLWLRAGEAAVPALAGLGAAWLRLPEPGPPPGLSASRSRRAAWEQRRDARRARAAAVAVSPALLVSLLAVRSDRLPALPRLADDPPSEVYRAGGQANAPPAGTAGRGGDEEDGVHGARRPRSAQVPDAVIASRQRIRWRSATSVGLPHSGRLIDGTQLPARGPDWVTWSPVHDRVPNVPNRLFGTEQTIRAILTVTGAFRVANPGAPRVLVGDISRSGGGPMTDEHVSHQNGLDVDVYFPRSDGTLRAPRAPEQIDKALAQDLLDRFVAAGAQVVFVGSSTGLHGPAGVVVPYQGHEYHMHVRFPPPHEG